MKIDCLLLLGGNQGDRLAALRRGLAGLAALPGASVQTVSRVYETAPMGPSERAYLNAVVKLQVASSPMGLLVECKRLESEAGRRPGRRWGSRPLDIDILDYGRRRFKNDWLEVPHPRLWERPFVLAPLSDVAPHYRFRSRVSVKSRVRGLTLAPSIVKIYPHGL